MSNSKEPVTGHVYEDTYETLEEWRNDRDISRSEAIRRLLRSGLKDDDSEESGVSPPQEFAAEAFMALGVVLLTLGGYTTVVASRAPLSFGLAAGGIVASGMAYHLRRRAHGD